MGSRSLRPERRVALAQRRRGQEDRHRARAEVGRVKGALLRAGDVAGPWVDGLDVAAVALGRARVEDQGVRGPGAPPPPCDSTQPGSQARRRTCAGATCRDRGLERPALRRPLRDAAVEHGHVVVAVGAQQVPEPRRDGAGLVVVGDHPRAGADARRAHHARDLLGAAARGGGRSARPGRPRARTGPRRRRGTRRPGCGPRGTRRCPARAGSRYQRTSTTRRSGVAEVRREPVGRDERLRLTPGCALEPIAHRRVDLLVVRRDSGEGRVAAIGPLLHLGDLAGVVVDRAAHQLERRGRARQSGSP